MKKSLFKVIKGISAFCISADNYITWIFILRKEAVLESSRNSEWGLVLQPTGRNVTKNELTKYLRHISRTRRLLK